MSNPATEEFTLLGPKPEVPPSWIESHAVELSLYVAVGTLLLGTVIYFLRRKRTKRTNPALAFREQMLAARAAGHAQVSQLSASALRNYLAAISADAPSGLTTQELAAAIIHSPVLATSADPILRVLRAADRVKFAGELSDHEEVARLAEEAFARLELARQALWREVTP